MHRMTRIAPVLEVIDVETAFPPEAREMLALHGQEQTLDGRLAAREVNLPRCSRPIGRWRPR
jgi:hypothetical protein